jgi:parallel beta-helix repeat protein
MNTKSILKSNSSKTTPTPNKDQYSTIKDRKKRGFAGDVATSARESARNDSVGGNNIANGLMGIDLYGASNNILRDNVLVNNSFGGFRVEGSAEDDFVNHVDTSNTINGKPIIYLINKQDLVIDPKVYPSIGYLAVVNSTNMAIEEFTLENSTDGIVLAWITNSLVDNVTVVGNYNGISLVQSRSNAIEESIIMNNENGIVFLNSSINNVTSNSIMENQCGIAVDPASSARAQLESLRQNEKKKTKNEKRALSSITKTQTLSLHVGENYRGKPKDQFRVN